MSARFVQSFSIAGTCALSLLISSVAGAQIDPSQEGQAECVFESLNNPFGNPTRAVHELNGRPYTGGFFNFRRLDAGTWSNVGGGLTGPGADTTIDAIMDWNGGIAYGGRFFLSGDVSTLNIGFWDDTAFQPFGPGLDERVEALEIWNGNLVAGGSFTATGDFTTTLPLIGMWDGQAWQPLGDGLSFSQAGFTARIWDMAVFQGDLYATGLFDFSGTLPVNGLARWDGVQWHAVGSGLSNEGDFGVGTSIEVHDGKLYLSGLFDTVAGQPASFIAVFDGTTWSQVGDAAVVHSLTMRSFGGRLYAGGLLTSFEIDGIGYGLAFWDGQEWVGVGSADGNILDLKISDVNPDQLILGGGFGTFNDETVGTVFTMTCAGFSPLFSDGFESGDTSAWTDTVVP